MKKTFKVFILVETSREYGRELLRGIYRYANLYCSWIIQQQTPFYMMEESQQMQPIAIGSIPDVDAIIMRDLHGVGAVLKRKIPTVLIRYLNRKAAKTHLVSTADDQISQQAADYFLERGFKHFAYLGYDHMFWSEDRKKTFTAKIEQAGYTCSVFRQAKEPALRQWYREESLLSEWLKKRNKPLALMACNDDRARQAVDACRMAGLNVPEQVAIVGVDNDDLVCNLSLPPISSVALNIEETGYRVAQLLDAVLKNPKHPRETITVEPTHVVTRQSSDILAIEDAVVAEAVRFVRDHARQPIQVIDILERVPVSRRGLYDKFKRNMGCSVHHYIKRVRVAEIERLLIDTDCSVSQIAQILGFSSADHIAQYFRSQKGMNPSVFRNRFVRK